MSIPYYIVLAITMALVLTHLRMKTVGRAFREGFDRGFDRGRDETNRLHASLPPVPAARHPLMRRGDGDVGSCSVFRVPRARSAEPDRI